ncbi:hypothetical protein TanjilG_12226 [Lupinus angustifolius]|uniref:Peptidase C14 caspase domain-containing protein n=1 Tax=Lupinus angustifolius TaxID=3871 RepID=A0A1J7IFW0_LUPAN|nr:PREDICTED: metacaspase-5-like [Lupinus angustifolius]OIW11707.1 hypothetical protein TanjilG_12226 [Lupinus angustifolius]
MAKKALLIGCNYPGTKAELKGCINDVWRMHNCLINRYNFSEEDITILIDTDHSYTQPTGKNIRLALSRLIRFAKPDDVLFVHYSGHGTRLPAETGEDDTGYDECIVPTDMNLITDDDFRAFINKVPRGCKITLVSDSCHSGGLIQAAKEQIGESTRELTQNSGTGYESRTFIHRSMEDAVVEERHVSVPHQFHGYVKNRSLSLQTLVDILKQKTGDDDIEVGKLRPTLFNFFGDDASPKVKHVMKFILNKLEEHADGESGEHSGILGLVGNLAQEFLKHKLEESDEDETHIRRKQEVHDGSSKGRVVDHGILLSGCQTNQTSADASPFGNSDYAYGAFSNAIQAIIEETDGEVTNWELVVKARKKLKREGFSQKPGLYCSDQYADTPFVC